MFENSDYKYAYDLYQKGLDADGELRKKYFRDALNALELVPDDYPGKSDLKEKIQYML